MSFAPVSRKKARRLLFEGKAIECQSSIHHQLYHSNTGSTTRNRKIEKKGKDSGKNFKSRNTQLLKELKRDLSADQFKAFKSSAKSFQSDKMSASDFVSLCLEEINIHQSILVKALRVLPNVEKREKALKILGL